MAEIDKGDLWAHLGSDRHLNGVRAVAKPDDGTDAPVERAFGWASTIGALLAVLCAVAACGDLGRSAGPSGSLPLTTSISGSPTPLKTLEMCQVVSPDSIASITGEPASVDVASSNSDSCTYVVGDTDSAGSPYFVIIRVEDGFEDLDHAKQAFGGGQDVPDVGDSAYWSPDVDVLWFEIDSKLFAVQLTNFDQPAEALNLARAVAEAAANKL